MNKLDYKERMRKIRYANKKKGLKWGKKEMSVAQEIVTKTTPKKETFKKPPKTELIGDILKKWR